MKVKRVFEVELESNDDLSWLDADGFQKLINRRNLPGIITVRRELEVRQGYDVTVDVSEKPFDQCLKLISVLHGGKVGFECSDVVEDNQNKTVSFKLHPIEGDFTNFILVWPIIKFVALDV